MVKYKSLSETYCSIVSAPWWNGFGLYVFYSDIWFVRQAANKSNCGVASILNNWEFNFYSGESFCFVTLSATKGITSTAECHPSTWMAFGCTCYPLSGRQSHKTEGFSRIEVEFPVIQNTGNSTVRLVCSLSYESNVTVKYIETKPISPGGRHNGTIGFWKAFVFNHLIQLYFSC